MKYQAVFFDLDDTLYDESTFVKSGFSAVAEYLSNLIKNDYGPSFILDRLLYFLEENGRGNIFNLILKELDLSEDKYVNTLIYIYRNHTPERIQIFEEMRKLIFELKKNSVFIGVITDGVYVTQRNKTDILLKNTPFDSIIHTDSLGYKHWKPSRVPFEVGINIANVAPNKSVYIGDNPVKDFKGANDIGMDSIWWNPNKLSHEFSSKLFMPCYQVDSYQNLKKVLS